MFSSFFCLSIDLFSHQPSWQGKVGIAQGFYISRLCCIHMEKRPDGIHLRSIAALNGTLKMTISEIAPAFTGHTLLWKGGSMTQSLNHKKFFFKGEKR